METYYKALIKNMFATGYYSGAISGVIACNDGKFFLFDTIGDEGLLKDRKFGVSEISELDYREFLYDTRIGSVMFVSPLLCLISSGTEGQSKVFKQNKWKLEARIIGAYEKLDITGQCDATQEDFIGKWGTVFQEDGY